MLKGLNDTDGVLRARVPFEHGVRGSAIPSIAAPFFTQCHWTQPEFRALSSRACVVVASTHTRLHCYLLPTSATNASRLMMRLRENKRD
jgi:hypothetical protein